MVCCCNREHSSLVRYRILIHERAAMTEHVCLENPKSSCSCQLNVHTDSTKLHTSNTTQYLYIQCTAQVTYTRARIHSTSCPIMTCIQDMAASAVEHTVRMCILHPSHYRHLIVLCVFPLSCRSSSMCSCSQCMYIHLLLHRACPWKCFLVQRLTTP